MLYGRQRVRPQLPHDNLRWLLISVSNSPRKGSFSYFSTNSFLNRRPQYSLTMTIFPHFCSTLCYTIALQCKLWPHSNLTMHIFATRTILSPWEWIEMDAQCASKRRSTQSRNEETWVLIPSNTFWSARPSIFHKGQYQNWREPAKTRCNPRTVL